MENETVRALACQHPKLVVIYTSQACAPCKSLVPMLRNIMNEPGLSDYHVVEINASEHHVADEAVRMYEAPLVVVTYDGVVGEAKTIKNESDFRSLFHRSG